MVRVCRCSISMRIVRNLNARAAETILHVNDHRSLASSFLLRLGSRFRASVHASIRASIRASVHPPMRPLASLSRRRDRAQLLNQISNNYELLMRLCLSL